MLRLLERSAATVARIDDCESADAESRAWVEALSRDGPERDRAAARLRELLLRAARFEISRRRAALPHLRGGDFDDLADQAANDAMVAVLSKLESFRGESRFSTWAYKFALLEAAVALRRRSWQGKEVPLADEAWSTIEVDQETTQRQVENRELLAFLRDAMQTDLSKRQREVLSAVALNGVPIDVLAARLNTTRGALYKTIHDARKRLRSRLAEEGLRFEEEEPTPMESR